MPKWHGDKGRKKTGGKVSVTRRKKKFELGSDPLLTTVGKVRSKKVKTKGGSIKIRALSVTHASVYDPSERKMKTARITDVVENPANPHFVRRGIVTKGATIETELGLARVTSRPSQHGMVSAVLIKQK
jgi:small subunit ribosomal protein S8e